MPRLANEMDRRKRLARRALNRRLAQAAGYAVLGFLALANAAAALLADTAPLKRAGLAVLALGLTALLAWRATIDTARLRRARAYRPRNAN